MHITDILSPGGRGTELSRTVARLREQEMAFRITHDDLAGLDQIARVSSRIGDASRWTELAVYHRPGENRPYLAVTEGHSVVPGEKLRFQYAAMGTLDRAMNWFEGSALRDELAEAIDRREEERVVKQIDVINRMGKGWRVMKTGDVLAMNIHSTVGSFTPPGPLDLMPVSGPYPSPGALPVLPSLTAALAWLYPGDDLSERARALAFERDFGMPERTVRNTLAIEAGRVEGKVGPWVQPMLVALRFMDRKAWEASRA